VRAMGVGCKRATVASQKPTDRPSGGGKRDWGENLHDWEKCVPRRLDIRTNHKWLK
jgi:hypothetical protein